MSLITFFARHLREPTNHERLAENDGTLKTLDLHYHSKPEHRFGLRDSHVGQLMKSCRNNTQLEELNLSNNMIGPRGAEHLSEALSWKTFHLARLQVSDNVEIGNDGTVNLAAGLERNSHLRQLDLVNCEVGPKGAKALGDMLRVNDTLKVLNLCINHIGDSGAQAIFESLLENNTLEELRISQCRVGDKSCRSLRKLLQFKSCKLKVLNLAYNSVSNEGMVEIAKGLKHNKTLKTIVLAANRIQNRGAQALAGALRENRRLRLVNIRGNAIDKSGLDALVQSLDYNMTLQSLTLTQSTDDDISADATKRAERRLKSNRQYERFGMLVETVPASMRPLVLAQAKDTPDVLYSVLREKTTSSLLLQNNNRII